MLGKNVDAHSPNTTYFAKLDDTSKRGVLASLTAMLEAAQAETELRQTRARNRTMMWRVMNTMGYRPLNDVFDKMGEDDLLEIYNSKFQIVFASPALFDLTSYTLEDLYCRPWTELWWRPEAICREIGAGVMQVVSPNAQTITLGLPPYEIRESSSYEHRRGLIAHKLFSPLLDRDGQPGFLSANEYLGPVQ